MKISAPFVAGFFLLVSATAIAQGGDFKTASATVMHHKLLNTHVSVVDTAEMPDERREEPFHKKHHVSD